MGNTYNLPQHTTSYTKDAKTRVETLGSFAHELVLMERPDGERCVACLATLRGPAQGEESDGASEQGHKV